MRDDQRSEATQSAPHQAQLHQTPPRQAPPRKVRAQLTAAAQAGLYRPSQERSNCGVALIADTNGVASHRIVIQGLEALARMEHRGAVGADPLDGDGAGVMIQIPDTLLRDALRRDALYSQMGGLRGQLAPDRLPPAGQYAVAMCMMARDPAVRQAQRAMLEAAAAEQGMVVVAWRDVPVRRRHLGRVSLRNQPHHAQAFLTWPELHEAGISDSALHHRLVRVRRAAMTATQVHGAESVYISSLSQRTLIYKGLVVPDRLAHYFVDLADRRCTTAFIVVHQRFSTNTAPAWRRAHPFRGIAHNGEINTRRGNRAWMQAREPLLAGAFPTPVLEPDGSDSADLDNAFELLVASGREPVHAMRMLLPPAWEGRKHMPAAHRAFYDWHSGLMEPWDGPACVIFSDGVRIGATLDRNGLRPARWLVTHDGLFVLASEAGVLDLQVGQIARAERLGPGGILELNLETGRLSETVAIDQRLAAKADWQALVDAARIAPTMPVGAAEGCDKPAETTETAETAREITSAPARPTPELQRLQRAFGYTEEDLTLLLTPMARTGKEPIGAMGDDTPLAVLSPRPQLLPHYFKQHFAQVTNPPIDPLRERLVMSLRVTLGPQTSLWPVERAQPQPSASSEARQAIEKQVLLQRPLLDQRELAALLAVEAVPAKVISLHLPIQPVEQSWAELGDDLEAAVERICAEAAEAVRGGAGVVVLSDQNALSPTQALVPPLLATSAVHQHLTAEGLRQRCGLVVASGEVREVMHVTTLLGFGAGAVCPWLALETVAALTTAPRADIGDVSKAQCRYLNALETGIRKVLSKMGIATLQGYHGARIYEAVGLSEAFTRRWFSDVSSQIGGIGAGGVAREVLARHAAAWAPTKPGAVAGGLDRGARYRWRRDGESHHYDPAVIVLLQHAVRSGKKADFEAYERRVNGSQAASQSLRGLLHMRPLGPAVPVEEVEPVAAIVRRFRTGAMSFGSLSKEAHELLAIAMNSIGARSNSGEGGEDPARYEIGPDGADRRSAIKQIASGRFGVTPNYLIHADELQIKMAQGAKPGEGGQLPGHKVDRFIARTRHSTPGVTLISPPPHHDIYSIEDLAQLITDLRAANDEAIISVKLVSRAGVGTIAAGVVKAGADRVLISGTSGGTGASPLSSIRHAGLPWELGLAEAQQVLMANDLRGRAEIEVDGQIKTGRDVVLAALMGAELMGFGTSALVASGCVLMRVCHKNTCPVGVATQDPALRARFSGLPEHVTRFMLWIAESVRSQLAALGARSLDEIVGRTDLLEARPAEAPHEKAAAVDLDRLLWRPEHGARRCGETSFGLHQPPDASKVSPASKAAASFDRSLCAEVAATLDHGRAVSLRREVRNVDRSIGTLLSSRLVKKYGPEGLPAGRVKLHLRGTAGQSFGAWLAPGMELRLEGAANDGVAKGMAGGKVVIRPSSYAAYIRVPVLVGNAALYGATGGQIFLAGRGGERFAVRNSGATAVVEGFGDHGCEYMTGGEVLVLGPTGRNLAAGMSGGMLWVVDERGDLDKRINPEMVRLTEPDEAGWRRVVHLLQQHHRETHSPLAWRLLGDLGRVRGQIVQVMPTAFERRWLERTDEATRRFASDQRRSSGAWGVTE